MFNYTLAPPRHFESLNEAELRYCDAINNHLRELEARFVKRALDLVPELERRVADPADWLDDYEIDMILSFQLRKDDPEFDENDDCFIAEQRRPLPKSASEEKRDYDVGALNYHHAESHIPITDSPHCRSYKEFYDGTYLLRDQQLDRTQELKLGWGDVLRIGTIYADLRIEEQTWRSFDD